MIIELTIENFKSIAESTTIKFAAGTTSRLSGNLLRHRNGERFVKSMAFYGANASGKTTILDALYALADFVLFSSKDQKPTARIPRFVPFALDRAFVKRPARVALTVEIEGARYCIDVSATADRVWNELLKVQHLTGQRSRKTPIKTLIERTWQPKLNRYEVTLNEDLGTELTRLAVNEQTTSNRLLLGKLAALNNEIARQIIEWFDRDLSFYDMHRNRGAEDGMLSESARLVEADDAFACAFVRFLKDADTGIQKIGVIEEKVVELVTSEPGEKPEFKETVKPGLEFRHATEDGSNVVFREYQESSGTRRFIALLAAILQSHRRPQLICIDELSASMHPDLVRRLIRIFHSRRYNPTGSQLLFTTHDTHLMDPTELLRRDQVTICDKNRFGRTYTKRLDDFQDAARSDANLQKQYLQGRFGGMPQFGPTLEDIPVDDEPLEVGL